MSHGSPAAVFVKALLVVAGLLVAGMAGAHSLSYTEVRFDRLNVEDGLSNGSVNAILQDRAGFMWFGSEDGLNRYDGMQFRIWRHEAGNPETLSSSNVAAITEDRHGLLWLGTWGNGLNRLDPATGRITRYEPAGSARHGFSGARVEFVFEDSEGEIWAGTEAAGLFRYRSREDAFRYFGAQDDVAGGLATDSVKTMAETPDGRLWIGTDDGLYEFDRNQTRFTRVEVPGAVASGSQRIRSLAVDAAGHLWVATRGDGLKHLLLPDMRWRSFRAEPGGLSENAVARVFVDSTGTVWAATYVSGLDRLDAEQGSFRHFNYTRDPTEEGISFRRIDAIFEDRGGMLWFGTRGGGINKTPVRPRGFRNFRVASESGHGLPHATVRSISRQSGPHAELFWIGTDGGGLSRFEETSGHWRTYPGGAGDASGLADSRIWSTLVDRENRVWVGTYAAGLHLLEPSSGAPVFRRYDHDPGRDDSLSSSRVQALMESYSGQLWVGTDRGLNRLRSLSPQSAQFDRHMHDPDDPSSLSDNHVTALLQDTGGQIWIGTLDGLNVLDPSTNEIRRFHADRADAAALANDRILSLHADASGTVWVGTEEGGLHAFDPATGGFRRYGSRAEYGGRIASILDDGAGRLWLGTSRGLARFDPARNAYRFFALSSDVRVLNFLPGAALATPSGVMYFGGLRGLVSFRPGDLPESVPSPGLIFTAVKRFDTGEDLLGGVPRDGVSLSIAHDAAFLRFEYAATDYFSPAENRYEHMLEGVDKDWVDTGNQANASYSKLAPGQYVFRVRAANSDGTWNMAGISAGVRVVPPVWQTWWFRVLIVAVGTALVYIVFLLRTRRIRIDSEKQTQLNSRLMHQIVERNRVEGEREVLIMELEARNAEMERFTYSVSHDLKSPLITIKGFLGLLRQDQAAGNPDRIEADIGKIEAATSRMNQLLDELLALSRAGKGAEPANRVGFGVLVKDALATASGEISARGVSVEVQAHMPDVKVDRVRMTEAIQNLVTNAVRFTGTQLHPRIEIGTRGSGDATIFYVRDNGIGIDPRHHDKVFELFERLDPETPGTGIGLALVKRIIELHGGEIWVESEGAGAGSTFCFRLPMLSPEQRVPEEAVQAAS